MVFTIQSVLPRAGDASGYLPHWLLFVSVLSLFNSMQTYRSTDLKLTKKVYNSTDQVTKLSARTFGTWTIITAIVRLYGAYYLHNKQIYELCMWSFVVAGGHFLSEWLIYGTTKLGSGLYGPLIVSSTSVTWMLCQKSHYVSSL